MIPFKSSLRFLAISVTLAFSVHCGSKQYYSRKLSHNPSIALMYEKGDIIIQTERKTYGRHNTAVTVNKKFSKKIPDTIQSGLQETVFQNFQKFLPGASLKIIDTIPVREIRTIHGKIKVTDYKKMKEDMIIRWKVDIFYRCPQSYYMDECKGEIIARMQFYDSTNNKYRENILVYDRPLLYINPEIEEIEEIEEITGELKEKLPNAIENFLKNLTRHR